MAVALLSSVVHGSPDGNGYTTAAIDTTGASLLVLALAYWSFPAPPTFFDSYANVWVRRLDADDSGDGIQGQLDCYDCANPICGPGHTFTVVTGPATYPAISVSAWSGTRITAPFNTSSFSVVGQANPQAGSVTPSNNDSLILAFLVDSQALTTFSIDSSFTIFGSVPHVFGQTYGLEAAYLIQGAKAAVNPAWTPSPGGTANAPVAILVHKEGGATAGPYILGNTRAKRGFIMAP